MALAAGCSRAPTPELVGTSAAPLISTNYDGSEMPKGTIALTFDDGPGDFGAGIADYLKSQGIQAAFFDNGDRFVTSKDLPNPNGIDPTQGAYGVVQKCLDDGHIVGNHTVSHRDLVEQVLPNGATQVNDELSETDTDLTTATATNYIPSGFFLFRSPYGSYNASVYADIESIPGKPMNKYVGDINWAYGGISYDYPNSAADWACWQGQITTSNGTTVNVNPGYPGYLTTQQCGDLYFKEITSGTTGGIVLMHDPYSWAQGNTLDMVKYLVPKLQAKGFKFVRVDDVPSIKAALPKCDASCATCNGVGPNYCTSCATGKFLDATAQGTSCTACSVCGTGTYQETACGKTSDTVCSACSTCAAGSAPSSACSAQANTVCSACPPGSYAGDGATSCTPCAAGTIAPDSGAAACTACPAGTDTMGPGQTACTACAAGTSSDGGAASCSTCAAGSYAPSASAACTECPAGTYSAAGAASCTTCDDGTYSDAGATSCTPCGSCDDGDSCTTDSCGATTGCSHAPISGCTSDAGAGDAAAPPTDAGGGAGSGSDGGTILTSGIDGGDAGGAGGGGESPTTTADGGAGGTSGASGGGSSGDDSSGGCNESGGGGSPVLVSFALGALLLRRRRRAA